MRTSYSIRLPKKESAMTSTDPPIHMCICMYTWKKSKRCSDGIFLRKCRINLINEKEKRKMLYEYLMIGCCSFVFLKRIECLCVSYPRILGVVLPTSVDFQINNQYWII